MGRTAKTATADKPLPLPLQFLAAWIGVWLGDHQARVIEYQRKRSERSRRSQHPKSRRPAPAPMSARLLSAGRRTVPKSPGGSLGTGDSGESGTQYVRRRQGRSA